MTKQEAIETIKLALSQVEWDYPLNYAAAFDMAISAMEKQDAPDTNVDTISRQVAIDLFPDDALEWDTKGGYIAPHLARRMICELPSAQPDGIPLEWIDKHLEWLDNCDNDFAQLAKVSIRAMVEIWKKDKT